MTKNYVNWTIIAPGKIARAYGKALMELSKVNDSIRCYGVGSRSLDKAQAFATEFGFSKAFGSYEDAIKDSETDAVYIAAPHSLHSELSLMALSYGKHVVCEKPAAINATLLDNVIKTAENKKLFFMEATWTFFNPTFLEITEVINSGKIGKIRHIDSSFCFSKPYDIENRLFNPSTAGGALLDVGIYPISFAMKISHTSPSKDSMPNLFSVGSVDEPRKISSTCRMEKGIDMWNCVNLSFANGITSTLQSAIDFCPANSPKDAYIYGDKGYIKIPLFWMCQEAFVYEYTNSSAQEANEIMHICHPFSINGYEYEALEATKCILEGKTESPLHPLYDSLAICQVMDNCRSQWKLEYPVEKSLIQKENTIFNVINGIKTMENISNTSSLNNNSPLIIYTDGGCHGNPGPGGWGCVIVDGSAETKYSGGEKNTTNNRMELMAAINALKAVSENSEWRNRKIEVFSDSQYVKNGITSWINSWKKNGWKTAAKKPVLNKELWVALDELYCNLNVEWKWVKGHAGVKYNEICDQLCQMEMAKL